MDPVTTAAGLNPALALSAATALGGGIANYFSGKETNAANLEMNRENNAANYELTHEAWFREDNAVQRRAGDLKKAGMSPVLAAGQGASSSSPIKMDAGHQENYAGEAIGSAISGALAASQLSKTDMDNRRTAAEIGKIGAETTNTMKNTEATTQHMEQQKIMNSYQIGAISAQTARTRTEALNAEYAGKMTKIDAEKAENTGVTPSSSTTAKNASDIFNFARKGVETLNPAVQNQKMMEDYYRKMKGGKLK